MNISLRYLIYILMCYVGLIHNAYGQSCTNCTATNTTVNQGVLLCLPFTGGSAADQSGNNFPVTILGGVPTITDRLGNANGAFNFNGSTHYFRLGDILDTVFCKSPAAKFSVSCWFKTTALPIFAGSGIMIAKSAGGASGPYQWSINHDADGKLKAMVCSNGSTVFLEYASTGVVPLNQWVHAVMTFDGTVANPNNRVRLYANSNLGTFSRTAGSVGPFCSNTAQEITIGSGHAPGNPTTPNNQYNGGIDDVRIYNRVLSQAEVSELYNGTPIAITPMPDVGLCQGDSVQLTAAGGTTYSWFPTTNLSNPAIANPYCKPTLNRTYYVTISNGACSNKDTVVVTLNTNCCVLANSINNMNGDQLLHIPVKNNARDVSFNPTPTVVSGSTSALTTDRQNNKANAYSFSNVTTDKITAASASKLSFPTSQSFSLSVWAKPRNTRAIETRIFSLYNGSGSAYEIMLTSAGKIRFLDFDGGTLTTRVSLSTPNAVTMNNWILITVIVNKADSTNSLYIDGNLAAQVKSTNTVQMNCSAVLGNHNLNAWGFDGTVDDARVYGKALTPTELLDLYYYGKTTILNADTTICSYDSVQVQTQGTADSYTWSPTTGLSDPFSANPVARPQTNTMYILTTVNGGCTYMDTLVINVNYATANAGIDSTICAGDSILLEGSGGARYKWTPSSSISNDTLASTYAKPIDTTDYVLTVTTATCVNSDTVKIRVNRIAADAGLDQTVCFTDSTQLQATGGTRYQWTPVSGLSSDTIANPKAKPLVPTTYYVAVTEGYCTISDSVRIDLITITPDAGPDGQVCPGDSIQVTATGGTSYVWHNNGFVSDVNSSSPYLKPPVTTRFYVDVHKGTCFATDSVTITVASTLTTIANNDTAICKGASAQMAASGGSQFTWTPVTGLSDPNISNPVATPDVTTPYYVRGQSGNCIAYDTVIVTVNALPTVDVGNDTTACTNELFQFVPSVVNANSYHWTPEALLDNPNSPYPFATISTRTLFTLVATNTNTGCVNQDELWVDVTLPHASFTVSPQSGDVPLTVNTTNNSTPLPLTYLWTFMDSTESYSVETSPYYTFLYEGSFKIALQVTDIYGCMDYDTVTVMSNSAARVYFPTAFTPNGDKKNEHFAPVFSEGLVQTIEGEIYNRWGQKVFTFRYPDGEWWDGKMNGQPADPGVYTYTARITNANNSTQKAKGSVTLIR